MEAVAHSPEFAKKVGIPQSVGKDFAEADKGKKFRKGGTTNPALSAINKQQTHHGKLQMPNASLNKYIGMKEGGMAHDDIKEDKKLIKKAFGMHDKQEHKGQHTDLSKLKKGGCAKMAKGGVARTVTKEMEYDYKTGKKSFSGSTAKRDAHAEKEGKIVAKHLAYDKDMDAMCGGGKVKKMATGGYVRAADGIAQRGKTKGTMV